MARNFAEIAFTDAVKALQEKHGSRQVYSRMAKEHVVSGLSEQETAFIAERDSFYMASIGESGFPYIQHRGGPTGFVKVLGPQRIGFLDFSGNRQYVSMGNFATHNRVSLIMVDYPARARLKIYAKVEILALEDDPALFAQLDLPDYKFRPERVVLLHIEAFDWNCPQHITPRFTVAEIETAFAPQRAYIQRLEAEIRLLKAAKYS